MTAPTPLLRTIRHGVWTVHLIQAGGQKLDGGAMFGVVPKPLWEKRIPADERNRIPLGMRCLLVEHDAGLILIDTGAGNKETDKFYEIYGIENRSLHGRTFLEDGIAKAGFAPEDIAYVINTHLHFDHGGGNTYLGDHGEVKPSFPNARYVVQRGEFEYATNTNERTAASYFSDNFVPLRKLDRWTLVDGDTDLLPGIRLLPTPGHVPYHQSVLIQSAGETACFLGDLVPTAAHLTLPWIMGYDVEPLVTLETKRRVLRQAMLDQWLVFFEHDAYVESGRVVHDGKTYRLADVTGTPTA
ncbi:MAG: MBL fold metallo-hydrolase [Gemmatimonadaceae bacterium]